MPHAGLLLAAGAALVEGAIAFAALPGCYAVPRAYSHAASALAVLPMPRDSGYHEMKTLDMDEQALPMHVRKTIENMPTEWQHCLADFVGSQRRESRLQHRSEMERQAEFGAALTCKLYFEGLKEGKQTDDHRLSRKHKENAEKAVQPFQRHRSFPEEFRLASGGVVNSVKDAGEALHTITIKRKPTKGDAERAFSAAASLLKKSAENALHLYTPTLHSIDRATVHASVSATLRLMGVSNRVDHTVYDGLRYMDVVVESNEDDRECTGKRGLVVQILPQNARASYVSAKTAALQEDTWAVLTVKPADWENKDTVQRTGWLARKLVKCGFWRETCQLTL